MRARHIKPKKIVFHSRLLPHETCRMTRVQHLKTKKAFLVFRQRFHDVSTSNVINGSNHLCHSINL
jgi:hypothetical protein